MSARQHRKGCQTKIRKTKTADARASAVFYAQINARKSAIFKNEPKEYVSEDKKGRNYEKNEKTGSGMIPYHLPVPALYVFDSSGHSADNGLPSLSKLFFNSSHKFCHYKNRTFLLFGSHQITLRLTFYHKKNIKSIQKNK